MFRTSRFSGYSRRIDTCATHLSPTLGTRLQSDAALSDSESGLKRSGQGQKCSGSAHGIKRVKFLLFEDMPAPYSVYISGWNVKPATPGFPLYLRVSEA
ncbi:hypothetical protein GBAR_LOCUS29498 [Geodia barretti]|uniref:Uncharacterized protein n=1 Tax=Geodia barretti TaxID=519541 RepID=A0AA35TVT9_GEOBA|nr:hypothetical protein GBAR_LOCUS29498 [Geodia barretti]